MLLLRSHWIRNDEHNYGLENIDFFSLVDQFVAVLFCGALAAGYVQLIKTSKAAKAIFPLNVFLCNVSVHSLNKKWDVILNLTLVGYIVTDVVCNHLILKWYNT